MSRADPKTGSSDGADWSADLKLVHSISKVLDLIQDRVAHPRLGGIELIAVLLLGIAVALAYRPFIQEVSGDSAFYHYVAQCIVRGQVPYRDVVDIKGPGSVYLSAAAMAVGKLIGARDICASRFLDGLFLGLLGGATYYVAFQYARSRLVAAVGLLFLLISPYFMGWTAAGGQPKLPMIMFGMISLLCVSKDMPFLAGLSSMLSCLCWQPGLMFAGAAFLIFTRYMTRWRDRRVLNLLLGGALPVAIVVLWFYHIDALRYFWSYAFEYNYSVFGPDANKSLGDSLSHIGVVMRRVFGRDILMTALAGAGLAAFATRRVLARSSFKGLASTPDLYRDAILMPPLVYGAFCLINFQSGPDLIPFFPFMGVFLGCFFLEAGRLAARNGMARRTAARLRLNMLVPAVAVGLLLALCGARVAVNGRTPELTMAEQDRSVSLVSNLLGPSDTIYVHGQVEILALLNRPNLNPYVLLDWRMDDYIAKKWYGGSFQRVLDEMEAGAPKVVALSRLHTLDHKVEIEQWVSAHYDKIATNSYNAYLRK
jgi:hypothetical protein